MEETKIIDLDGVLARLEGDMELYHEIVQIFFDGYSETFTQLKELAQNGNVAQIGPAAHAAKGALGNLGAARAFQKALLIERASKEGKLVNPLADVEELRHEVDAFRSEYERMKAENRL